MKCKGCGEEMDGMDGNQRKVCSRRCRGKWKRERRVKNREMRVLGLVVLENEREEV